MTNQTHNNLLRIALVQHSNKGSRENNLDYIVGQLQTAAEQGAKLAVLQELHNGPYFCQSEDPEVFAAAEQIDGPTFKRLSKTAQDCGLVIVASIFEDRAPGLAHNTAIVIESDGSLAGVYRKMHIPEDPGYHEKFYFTPGDLGFEPVNTSVGRLGVLVCWDQWYPEAARLMTLAGAEILIYPTAIGWDPNDDEAEQKRQQDAWQIVQRGHAVANGLPVAACNRVGFESDPTGNYAGQNFWGNSFVSGPQGELLAQAGDSEELIICDIDRDRIRKVRRIWPFLRDRRIDAYSDISQRFLR